MDPHFKYPPQYFSARVPTQSSPFPHSYHPTSTPSNLPHHFIRPFVPSTHNANSMQLSMKMSDLALHEEEPMKGEPEACLFVASLNAQRTDEQLTESVTKHFCKWGRLMNVKVMKDWMNRPYAFVQYNSIEDARLALEESHDTIIDGRHIRVEQARVNRTLFLAKLPKSMTEDTLKKYLEKWGQVEGVTLLYNHATKKSKGCGFAKFRYREDAIRAYLHIRQQSKWSVEWASNIEKQQTERDRHSVFIGQLNAQLVTQELLEQKFSQYGPIESLHLVNKNGEAFAFLRFEEEESAQMAIEMENGSVFLDRWIKVQYREAPEARTPKKAPPPMPLQLPTPGMARVMREDIENTDSLQYPIQFQQTHKPNNRGFAVPAPPTDLSPVSPTEFNLESGRYFRTGFRPVTFAHTSAPASPSPPTSPIHSTFPLHCRASSSPHIRMPMPFPPASTPVTQFPVSDYLDPTSQSYMAMSRNLHTRQHSSGPLSLQTQQSLSNLSGPASRYPRAEMNLFNVSDFIDDKSQTTSTPPPKFD